MDELKTGEAFRQGTGDLGVTAQELSTIRSLPAVEQGAILLQSLRQAGLVVSTDGRVWRSERGRLPIVRQMMRGRGAAVI
jgi:hypothetical protein